MKKATSLRSSQACERCRIKRIRCSGDNPCQRCEQQGAECVFGFGRGDRKKVILNAIGEPGPSSLHYYQWPESAGLFAASSSLASSPRASRSMSTSLSAGRRRSVGQSPGYTAEASASTVSEMDGVDGDVKQEDMKEESDFDLDDLTDSSLASPVDVTSIKSESGSKRAKAKSRGKGRKTRISSACMECKKRRRRCTGDEPCQTCSEVHAECVYDPTMDRRSKAYFQRRLADGLAGVVQSDKSQDELMSMLRENGNLDADVAAEVEKALQRREDAAFSPRPQSPIDTIQDGACDGVADRSVCYSFCGVSASGSPEATWYSDKLRQQQELKLRGPLHLILPFVIADQSPLSMIFITFRNGVSNMLAQGMPLTEVLGPLDPVADLLFRPRSTLDPFSASTWACELARIDPTVDIVTQLANAFLLSRLMRWSLSPTLENFLLLPKIMRPTMAQRTIPHFASADLYAIPAVRDYLITGHSDLLERIGTPGRQGIKFHWHFDMSKAVDINPSTGVKSISRLFGMCASELSNWSCGTHFLAGLPLNNGLLKVVEHQHDWNFATGTASTG